MKKVLITGAGGYIGSIAAYMFLERGYKVVAVDNYLRGFRKPLEWLQTKFPENLRIYEKNISEDLSPIFRAERDIVAAVHYAALCSVDESTKNPQIYFENNVCGCLNLITSLLAHGIKNLVFSSTCAVYGNAKDTPINEEHSTNPTNPYGASKLMAEQIMGWFSKSKDLNYVTLRYFNVCGASDDGEIGDAKHPSVHLMQNAVRGALGLEPFYLTYQEFDSTPDGSPIRDYTNVVDLNEAHIKAVEYLLNGGRSEVINLGTGAGNTVLEIVKKVEVITGAKIKTEKSTTARQGEYDRAVASIDKAAKVLGWKPERSLEQSINSLAKWYNSHPNGWER